MPEIIRVDLHCHSSASDGDHAPGYVAHQLAGAGVSWAALTDHNSVRGLEQFQSAVERRGMRYIPGVEIHARSPRGPVHLLGYGFDPGNEALLSALQTFHRPWGASVCRLARRVFSPGKQEVQVDSTCTSVDSDDHSRRQQPDTTEAICLIHEAGGRVLLAHPLAGLKTIERLEEYLDWLQPQGLDGIEAFYKLYFRSTQQDLSDLAERRGLLTAGGSDFHGLHHSDGTSPGVDMPLEQLDRFLAAIGLTEDQGTAPAELPSSGGSLES
jgi:predicted metal-dependent phosphoesterase TrpH